MTKNQKLLNLQKVSKFLGFVILTPLLLWFLLALFTVVPSMIDVFGYQGLKVLGSLIILSLLMCAFGFEKFN